MKQKLFGALALSVALAACTNEEELVIATNGGNAQLAGRPVIGQVDLTTTPATRAAVVDGTWGALTYKTGDAIGAALVDEPNLTSEVKAYRWYDNDWRDAKWTYAEYVKDEKKNIYSKGDFKWSETEKQDPVSGFYDLCGSTGVKNVIHTNYGYSLAENGKWTTEANLVEGHYMFYFPFNANNSSRMPINIEIPTSQDCTDGNSIIDKFYAESTSPIAVDVKFLQKPAAGQKVAVSANPQHLFSYPQIKIVNNFNSYVFNAVYKNNNTQLDEIKSNRAVSKDKATKTMTIKKVELFYTGSENKLWAKATINASMLNTAVEANWEANKFMKPSYTSAVTESPEKIQFNENKTKKPYLPAAKNNAGYSIEQVITCNIEKELAYGQSYTFNAIMPAEKYQDKDKTGALAARVYVTIGTQDYVLLTADVVTDETNGDGSVKSKKATNYGYFKFGKTVELVRGERYPVIEYNTNSDGETSVKTTAGNILTINLQNLSAFEVGTNTPDVTSRGFTNADEFVAHMQNATRGETLEEISNIGSGLREHEIAFKNNITLDAALVEAIYNNVIYDNPEMTAIKLNFTNLAIANDVEVTKINDTKYKLKGNGKFIYVEYKATGVINNDGTKLVSGINIISSACELAKKSGNAGLGVVYLTGNQSYDIKNAADSFRMTLTNGSSLTVNGNCNANITTESGSTVTIGNDGSLTNASSVLNDGTTINNNKMKTIAANVKGNQVFASISAWPSSVPAASKVNNITINATGTITVEQAGFNIFNANTTITLAPTVNEIRSNADVNLTTTNIKQLNGTSCQWIGGSNGNIVVTVSNKHAINSGITAGNACSINTITQ